MSIREGPMWSAKHQAPTVLRPRRGNARRTVWPSTRASRLGEISRVSSRGATPHSALAAASSTATGPLIQAVLDYRGSATTPHESQRGPSSSNPEGVVWRGEPRLSVRKAIGVLPGFRWLGTETLQRCPDRAALERLQLVACPGGRTGWMSPLRSLWLASIIVCHAQ